MKIESTIKEIVVCPICGEIRGKSDSQIYCDREKLYETGVAIVRCAICNTPFDEYIIFKRKGRVPNKKLKDTCVE